MDTRTLIFSLGLFNLSFALVVFVYQRCRKHDMPHLRAWQLAKLVAGSGYLLGWSRPLWGAEWVPWIYAGNLMQWLGIAMELAVYARFLGAPRWVPVVRAAMMVAVPVFIATVWLASSNHPMILVGTGIAALLYLAMSALSLNQFRQSPQLLLMMSALDGALGGCLALKVIIGLLGVELVSYQNNGINIGLYTLAFVVMCINGFGFLLQVQQRFEQQLQQAKEAAERLNQALESANAQLSHMATTDMLTGLWNRRHFESMVRQEMARADRHEQALSLLIFDLDHFKGINDIHGHLAGDRVLVELTALARQHTRGCDLLARWGGEEFMLLMPDTGPQQAMTVAEKLRSAFEAQQIPQVGRVTASFGVAGYLPNESLDSWISRIDAALYQAKQAGRNSVRLASVSALRPVRHRPRETRPS